MERGDPDPLAELERGTRQQGQVEPRRGRVRPEVPDRQDKEHPGDADASEKTAGDQALDPERDERGARIDRGVELTEEVLAADCGACRRLVEAEQVEEVRELHEEVPEEHAHAEGAEQAIRRDGAVAIDRLAGRRAQALGPMLVVDATALSLWQATIRDERQETDEESDGLRADVVLRVDDGPDRGDDGAAEDLADEDGTGEEREQSLRLLGVVQVARVDPEQDVDRLLHAVREDVRDRLDDVADGIRGDRVLDPDR